GVAPEDLLESWASLLELGPKVQEALGGNPVIGFGGNKDWPAQSIVQSNGGFILDEDDNPVMDSPEAIAAMQAIADLDKAGLYDSSTSKEIRASFAGGSTACYISSIAALGG